MTGATPVGIPHFIKNLFSAVSTQMFESKLEVLVCNVLFNAYKACTRFPRIVFKLDSNFWTAPNSTFADYCSTIVFAKTSINYCPDFPTFNECWLKIAYFSSRFSENLVGIAGKSRALQGSEFPRCSWKML